MASLEETSVGNLAKKSCLPSLSHGSLHDEIETFQNEEMTMLCLKCGNYLNLSYLPEHRSFHEALAVFNYDIQSRPKNTKDLASQRSILVKKLTQLTIETNMGEYHKELRKIDLAFEILKSDLCGRSNKPRVKTNYIHNEVQIRSRGSMLNDTMSIGVAQTCNEKWKSIMEDTYDYRHNISSGVSYFALFDGYNGSIAAQQCAKMLHTFLDKHMKAMSSAMNNVCDEVCSYGEVFRQAYKDMDNFLLLGENETSKTRWSGCSLATFLLSETYLHVSSAGTVKAMTINAHDMKLQTLTTSHSLENRKERKRVKKVVDIDTWLRTVWTSGVATTTRGLGNHGDPFLKSTIVNVPDCGCVPLAGGCHLILVASGGFWEVFNEDEVLVLFQDWLEMKEIERYENCKNEMNENWDNMGIKIPNNNTEPATILITDDHDQANNVDDANTSQSFSESLRTLQSHIGSCKFSHEISKHFVCAALNGGAKSNITVMTIVMNEKILT